MVKHKPLPRNWETEIGGLENCLHTTIYAKEDGKTRVYTQGQLRENVRELRKTLPDPETLQDTCVALHRCKSRSDKYLRKGIAIHDAHIGSWAQRRRREEWNNIDFTRAKEVELPFSQHREEIAEHLFNRTYLKSFGIGLDTLEEWFMGEEEQMNEETKRNFANCFLQKDEDYRAAEGKKRSHNRNRSSEEN